MDNLIFIGIVFVGLLAFLWMAPDRSQDQTNNAHSAFKGTGSKVHRSKVSDSRRQWPEA